VFFLFLFVFYKNDSWLVQSVLRAMAQSHSEQATSLMRTRTCTDFFESWLRVCVSRVSSDCCLPVSSIRFREFANDLKANRGRGLRRLRDPRRERHRFVIFFLSSLRWSGVLSFCRGIRSSTANRRPAEHPSVYLQRMHTLVLLHRRDVLRWNGRDRSENYWARLRCVHLAATASSLIPIHMYL
jgi:hypothetical protein